MVDSFVICNDILEVGEPGCIVAPRDPKLQIASTTVFLAEVRNRTFDMSFAVKVGIMLESELDGAAYDGVSFNHPVSLSHKHSVDAAWSCLA